MHPTNTIELRVRKDVAVHHYGDSKVDSSDDTAPRRSRTKGAEVDATSSLSNIV